jgi:hypothetical protein
MTARARPSLRDRMPAVRRGRTQACMHGAAAEPWSLGASPHLARSLWTSSPGDGACRQAAMHACTHAGFHAGPNCRHPVGAGSRPSRPSGPLGGLCGITHTSMDGEPHASFEEFMREVDQEAATEGPRGGHGSASTGAAIRPCVGPDRHGSGEGDHPEPARGADGRSPERDQPNREGVGNPTAQTLGSLCTGLGARLSFVADPHLPRS